MIYFFDKYFWEIFTRYWQIKKFNNKIRKTKIKRKRCVECDKLYKDDDLNMTYYFKTEEESQQHDIKKYEDDYDIEDHLDYTKPYGYVCDWCRSD